jgi:hypothetical protein
MLNKNILGGVMLVAAAAVSSGAMAAGDRDFNTAAGAVIGAAIGSNSGPNGALVGGLVGAAVGNAITPNDRYYRGGRYVETRVYANPAPVYYEPAPVYYAPPPPPPPRYYAPPRVVYVEPARPYREVREVREYRRDYYYDDRGHHHGRW